MYDITIRGSLIDAGATLVDALRRAQQLSESTFPGRLVRVHGVDGVSVEAEYRNGEIEEFVAL